MPTSPPPQPDALRSKTSDLLVSGLRDGLSSPTPGALLSMASMLLAVTGGSNAEPERTADVVRGLLAQDRPEASAGALAVATLADDAALRRWARRDIADRGHFVPRWLAGLHLAVPADRALELSGPFRDLDDLVAGVTLPTGHCLTAVVRVDNEFGSRAVDAAVLDVAAEHAPHRLDRPEDAAIRMREIEATDARARIAASLGGVDLPPTTGNEWRSQRPLLRWILSGLPAGGDPRVPGASDVDLDEVVDQFLTSPWGRPWIRHHLPALVEHVFGDGLANGLGDPLLWAPHHVARLLDPALHDRDPDQLDAVRTPELLRDVIRFGHAERGLRPELTDRSLLEVDRRADAFLLSIRPQEEAA